MTTLPPVSFYYLRHGETDWNAAGRSQGQTDIPLNANGLAQARAAGPRLAGRGISTIIASPLSRARVTAEIVGESLGIEVGFEPDLREVGFGVHEGQTQGDWFPDWLAGKFTPERGESFATLRARVSGALARALTHPPIVLIVAHGAVFRAVRSAMGLGQVHSTRNADPIHCQAPTAGRGWSVGYLGK
jgi:probable phosphoglycerate mutase